MSAPEARAAPNVSAAPEPILEMRGISKTFPGVKALSDVSLQIYPGEVHALMGENGAGKSTLMKILSGAYQADPGGEGGLAVIQGHLTRFPKIDAVFTINDPQAIGTTSRRSSSTVRTSSSPPSTARRTSRRP